MSSKDKKEKTNEYAKKLIERATALVNQEYKNKCESYVRDDMSVICIFFPQALAKQIAVLREQLTLLHEKLNSLKAALEVLKAGL